MRNMRRGEREERRERKEGKGAKAFVMLDNNLFQTCSEGS